MRQETREERRTLFGGDAKQRRMGGSGAQSPSVPRTESPPHLRCFAPSPKRVCDAPRCESPCLANNGIARRAQGAQRSGHGRRAIHPRGWILKIFEGNCIAARSSPSRQDRPCSMEVCRPGRAPCALCALRALQSVLLRADPPHLRCFAPSPKRPCDARTTTHLAKKRGCL